MTLQATPAVGGLLLLVAGATLVCLFVVLVVQLARSLGGARRTCMAIVLLAVGYAAILAGVGLTSVPVQLRAGDVKCFDDWCAAMTGTRHDPSPARLIVEARLENHGRGRAMRSNLARAFIDAPGRRRTAPIDGAAMQSIIAPAGHVDIALAFDANAAVAGARLVITEWADSLGPGTFTIGDEASPFHAQAGWPLELP